VKRKQRKEDEEGNVLRVKRGGGRTETRSLPFAGRSGERKEQGEGDGGGEREKQEGWKDGYAEGGMDAAYGGGMEEGMEGGM